jgi:hypothetical protein
MNANQKEIDLAKGFNNFIDPSTVKKGSTLIFLYAHDILFDAGTEFEVIGKTSWQLTCKQLNGRDGEDKNGKGHVHKFGMNGLKPMIVK